MFSTTKRNKKGGRSWLLYKVNWKKRYADSAKLGFREENKNSVGKTAVRHTNVVNFSKRIKAEVLYMYVYKARQMFSQRFSEKRRRRTRQLFIIHPSLFSRLFLFISAVTNISVNKNKKKDEIISNLHSYYPTGILYLPY